EQESKRQRVESASEAPVLLDFRFLVPGGSATPKQVEAVYIGDEGSLAHVAAVRFFKHLPATRLSGVGSFSAAFKAVASGKALYGVVPIENSASGTLHSTYDLMLQHDVVIGGELGVREVYCLCAKPGVSLHDVTRVLSHPNILEACTTFLSTRLPSGRPGPPEPSLETVPTISTTEAAKRVNNEAASAGISAAIATKEAAQRHSLSIIAEDIGNDAFLETRYILFHLRSGEAATLPTPFPRDALSPLRKRSACFALRNEPQAVYKLLSCFALRNIDVLKVETRPMAAGLRSPPGLPNGTARLWDYLFYVEFAVPPGQTKAIDNRLWENLSEFSLWQRDFGSYPSQLTVIEKQPQTWSDMVDMMTKS
ncbi:unnamed protein product, partial [Polarella glacialis]